MAISYVGSGAVQQGANPTIPVPSGYQKNDLLVIFASVTGSPTTPSGWTLLTLNSGIGVYYKFAAVSESSVSLSPTGTAVCSVMSAYRNVSSTDTVSTFVSTTSTTVTTNTLTTTYVNEYVISVFASNSTAGSWTAPASTTTRVSSNGTVGFRSLLVVDELQATAGTSTARTGTYSASASLNAISFSIRPSNVAATGNWLMMFR